MFHLDQFSIGLRFNSDSAIQLVHDFSELMKTMAIIEMILHSYRLDSIHCSCVLENLPFSAFAVKFEQIDAAAD
jgi:hypothetical protein